jgi:hypothetical protein
LKLILSDRAAGSSEMGIDTSPKARKPFHAAAIDASKGGNDSSEQTQTESEIHISFSLARRKGVTLPRR